MRHLRLSAGYRDLALVVLVLALLLACGPSLPRGRRTPTAPPHTSTPTLAATPTSTRTPSPTDTPEPTNTRRPTATPRLTKEATPTASPTPQGPSRIRLEADGSGDYTTLYEAIGAAAEGATIILGPGAYELAEPLAIGKSLRLIGYATDDTVIFCSAGDFVVRFYSLGSFGAENLTLRHDGDEPADVVQAASGAVDFRRVAFGGAVWDEVGRLGGVGLNLYGNASGKVRECWMHGNELYGILLSEQAHPTLEDNTVSDNDNGGISYWDDSGGTARRNYCADNGYYGIAVNGDARPTLEDNDCRKNVYSGIAYFDRAGGVARGNECVANGRYGILVGGEADPTLEDNLLGDNQSTGLYYYGNAGGSARGNTCSGNFDYGIYLDDDASPALEDNECEVYPSE